MKKTNRIAVALIVLIIIVGGIFGFSACSKSDKKLIEESSAVQTTDSDIQTTVDDVTDIQAQSLVVSTDTSYYNVSEEVGGFFGVIIDINLPKGVDGYEFMSVWNVNTKTLITQPLTVNDTKLYYGTQAGPREILIRAYDDNNGERVYGEWYTAVDATTPAEKDIDVKTWNELTQGRVLLEPSYWDN